MNTHGVGNSPLPRASRASVRPEPSAVLRRAVSAASVARHGFETFTELKSFSWRLSASDPGNDARSPLGPDRWRSQLVPSAADANFRNSLARHIPATFLGSRPRGQRLAPTP